MGVDAAIVSERPARRLHAGRRRLTPHMLRRTITHPTARETDVTWLNFNPEVHWPFSGAVTQDIHPSLLAKSGSDEIEVRTLREVASYGRQIGVLSDLVLALVDHIKPEQLGESGDHALDQLREMVEQIKLIKQDLPPLPDSYDAAQTMIKALQKKFPKRKST